MKVKWTFEFVIGFAIGTTRDPIDGLIIIIPFCAIEIDLSPKIND